MQSSLVSPEVFIKLFHQPGIAPDSEVALLEEKWKMLSQMEMDDAIIFGKQGCLTDSSLNTVLKVFCMSKEEFLDFRENEGWEEDDENEEDIALALSNDGLPNLKAFWKKLVYGATTLTLHSYNKCGEAGREQDPDKLMMENKDAFTKLNSRQQRALHVRHGQKSILYEVLELTKP